MHIRHCCSF